MNAVVLHEVGGPLSVEDVPEPRRHGRRRPRGRDQLRRRADPPRPLPADAGAAVRARQRGRRRARRPARARAAARRRRLRGTRRGRPASGRSPLPDNASFAAGASFLTTYLTAYIPLHRQVRVGPASTVLVHAGSGGVGCAAIQLAKRLGATVIATASTDEKRAFARGRAPTRRSAYDEIDDLRVDVVSIRSAATSSRARCRCSTRSGRSSRSASPAGSGPIRACSGSSGGMPRSSASTSAG